MNLGRNPKDQDVPQAQDQSADTEDAEQEAADFEFEAPEGGFLSGLDLEDVPEEHVLDEGEYELELTKVTFGPSKKGKPMITAFLTHPDDPDARLISDYILYPTSDMDPRQYNQARRQLKSFLETFGIPSDISQDEFSQLGDQKLTGLCYVTKDEYQGREQNRVSRYMGATQ